MSLALLLGSPLYAYAQNNSMLIWQPRTLQEVRQDIAYNSNGTLVYKVKYGDTLSVIAEALDVDLNLLATVNEVTNVDLIFPDTVFTLNYNQTQKPESLTITEPQETDDQEPSVTEVDLINNSVTYQGEEYILDYEKEAEVTYLTNSVDEFIADDQADIVTSVKEVDESIEVEELVNSETVEREESVETLVEPVEEWTEEASIVETEESTETTELNVSTETAEENSYGDVSYEYETNEIIEEPIQPQPPVEEITEEVIEQPIGEETIEETNEHTPVEESFEIIEEFIEEPIVEEAVEETTQSYDVNLSNVENFKQAIINQFGITDIGGYRPGDPGDHGRGKALDVMVPVSSATGDAVAQFALDNMDSYGISYVIWKQQIYGDWNRTWELMEDRGSITQNHYDHVHISFY